VKPVNQTITTIPGGNCFAACVASLLELPLEDVPNFCAMEPHKEWFQRFVEWLHWRGLGASYSPYDDVNGLMTILEGYCIMGVRTENPENTNPDEWHHSVVGLCERTGESAYTFSVVHDPNPAGWKLTGHVDVVWIVRNAS